MNKLDVNELKNKVQLLLRDDITEQERQIALKYLADNKNFDISFYNSNIDNLITILNRSKKSSVAVEVRLSWKIISSIFQLCKSELLYVKALESGLLQGYLEYLPNNLTEMVNMCTTSSRAMAIFLHLHSSLLDHCFIGALDYLSVDMVPSYIEISVQLLLSAKQFKTTKESIKQQRQNFSPPLQQTQSVTQITSTIPTDDQIQSYYIQLEELSKKVILPFNGFCELIKQQPTAFYQNTLNSNLNCLTLVCQELFTVYEMGVDQKSAPLLLVNTTFRSILIDQPAILDRINYTSALEKSLSSLKSNFIDRIKYFQSDSRFEVDSKIPQYERPTRLFKYLSKVLNYFFESFGPKFDSHLLSLSIQTIKEILIELPPNKSITNQDNIESIKQIDFPLVKTLLQTLLQLNSNDNQWIEMLIELILSNNSNSNNSNSGILNRNQQQQQFQQQQLLQNSFGQLKLILLIFQCFGPQITLPIPNFKMLNRLFESSVQCLNGCIGDIYQTTGFNGFITSSFHNFILKSTIAQHTEFFGSLVSLLYYSNVIVSNFLIDMWFTLIQNSSNIFKVWNLNFILGIFSKFNNRYEVLDFINNCSVLLKRVFGILDEQQMKLVYNGLVKYHLDNVNIDQDSVKSLPISIGTFFYIIDDESLELPNSMKKEIQTKLVPFLVSILNQVNIYSKPNLMENILLLLSRVKLIDYVEIIQMMVQISMGFLSSICSNIELRKLFADSFTVLYVFEILGNHIGNVTASQLNSILSYSSQLSGVLQISKYPICNLISKITQSPTANQYLSKLDPGSTFGNLKTIYQNLFKSSSLLLYLNIENTLNGFLIKPDSTATTGKDSFIILNLNEIIPSDEQTRIHNYLKQIPQKIDKIPISDDERFKEHMDTIISFDGFKKNNLKERFSQQTNPINISSVFPLPTSTSPNLISQQQQINSSIGGYDNINDVIVSPTGKLYKPNQVINGYSKDEMNLGLDMLKQGFEKISKQISYGLKMDKSELEKYRTQYKKLAYNINEMGDSLF